MHPPSQGPKEVSSSSSSMEQKQESSAPKQVILSWSGGKDSTMCLYTLLQDPLIQVVGLLTSITSEYDRVSIHGVRRELHEAQTASLGLPVIEINLQPACSNEAYEAAFNDGLSRAKAQFPQCHHLAFGDLFLEDVRAYREKSLEGSGYTPIFPIWGQDTTILAHQVVEKGFKAHLVCVDTTQLDGAFAGRLYGETLLSDLPSTVDPCGEKGEFHTFVSDGPIFRQPVSFIIGEKVLREKNRFMFCDLVPTSSSSSSSSST